MSFIYIIDTLFLVPPPDIVVSVVSGYLIHHVSVCFCDTAPPFNVTESDLKPHLAVGYAPHEPQSLSGGSSPFVFQCTTIGTYGRLMLVGFSDIASVIPSLVWGQRASGVPAVYAGLVCGPSSITI